MKTRVMILIAFSLIGGCKQEAPQAPELPPVPEHAAVRDPIEEIGQALLKGGVEEKRKALASIQGLDPAVQKQQQKTLHDLLRHCLSAEDPALRKEAAQVFVKLEDGLGGLVRSLGLVPESDEDVLGVALETLGTTLDSGDPKQKLQALDLLSEIGRPAVGLLLKSLKDDSADVRLGALDALWSIGSLEPEFAQRISALTKDPDPRVRQAAAAAVERLQEDREEPPHSMERRAPAAPMGD